MADDPPSPVIVKLSTLIVVDVLKFNPVNTKSPVDPSYVALVIIAAAFITVIPAEAALAPVCQPDAAVREYVVVSGADVPSLFNIRFTAAKSAPARSTVALVELTGIGLDVADVNVTWAPTEPCPFIVSLVTSIVDDVLKFNPVNIRFPFNGSYVALLIVDAALLTVIPIVETAKAPDCQPDETDTLYVVVSRAAVPLLFKIRSTAVMSVPAITTVALVEFDGVGFDVADVNVYLSTAPPWPVIVSLVTSIVDDVLKFNPVNTRYPFDELYVALLITSAALLSVMPIVVIAAAPVCQPDAAARLYTVESWCSCSVLG